MATGGDDSTPHQLQKTYPEVKFRLVCGPDPNNRATNVILVQSFQIVGDTNDFVFPIESQPIRNHPALRQLKSILAAAKCINQLKKYRNVQVSMTKTLYETYFDEDGIARFGTEYLQVCQRTNQQAEPELTTTEEGSLQSTLKDAVLEKFDGTKPSPNSWINEFEKETIRLQITDENRCIALQDFVTDKAKEWHQATYKQIGVSTWAEWKKLFNGYFGIKGVVPEHPGSNPLGIEFEFSSPYLWCPEGKKRKVSSVDGQKFIKKMVNENMFATSVQKVEAAKIMEFGDQVPASLPNLNASRVMKCCELQSSHLHSDPILAIFKMKATTPYNTILQDIGYDPFFLHYWSAAQIDAYRQYTRETYILRISIAAAGSVVKPINLLSNRQTRPLFLYEIAVNDKSKKLQFAVAHMISERHNNSAIAFWLQCWVRTNIQTPKICVTDDSRALMMACVRTFTQYSTLNQYISVCSSLLEEEDLCDELPSCMIRNDFAHLMHLISMWEEVKYAPRESKNFYLRTAALIIESTSFERTKDLLNYFFIVLLNKKEGFNENMVPCACENAKQYLQDCISRSEVDNSFIEGLLDDSKDIDPFSETFEEDEVNPTTIYDEILSIYEDAMKGVESNNGNQNNFKYHPGLAEKFLQFSKTIVIWSAIMVPIFSHGYQTESSAPSESLFKELKRNIFKNKDLPVRLDDFISIHIEYVTEKINIVISEQQRENMSEEDLLAEEDNQEEENQQLHTISRSWKAQKLLHTSPASQEDDETAPTISTSPEVVLLPFSASEDDNSLHITSTSQGQKNEDYLKPDLSIIPCNPSSKSKTSVVGHLLNGSYFKLKDKPYKLLNTCAFDSISQIIMCAYADSELYSNFIDSLIAKDDRELFFKMITNAMTYGITAHCYSLRLEILLGIERLRSHEQSGLTALDVACTANLLIDELFSKYPSYMETRICSTCNQKVRKERRTLCLSILTEKTITEKLNEPLNCLECLKNKKLSIPMQINKVELQDHLIIEFIQPSHQYKGDFKIADPSLSLYEIPKQLNIMSKNFVLRGIICFQPPKPTQPLQPPAETDDTSIGHYTAYCWRSHIDRWQLYDDIQKEPKDDVQKTLRVKIQYIFYCL